MKHAGAKTRALAQSVDLAPTLTERRQHRRQAPARQVDRHAQRATAPAIPVQEFVPPPAGKNR
jgi:hypothetical protein